MTHYLARDDKYRGSSDGGEHLPYLAGYRFGLNDGKRGPSAVSRVNGWLKAAIEAIVNSKLRRMNRELLRGGRYHPEDHYMRGPGPKWREKHPFERASAGDA
jgi:hypothetical protein